MEVFAFLWDYVVPFLVVLTALVFVHELGHYWVARRNGVRVEIFSIGFGPELFGRNDSHGTRWRLSAIPVGGYVKFFGENLSGVSPEEAMAMLSPEERETSFFCKRVSQRIAIVFAGPAANFIFAWAIMAVLYATAGLPYSPAEVMEVVPGSAAEEAGFRPGDRVVRIGGQEIERFEEMRTIVMMSGGEALEFEVLRDGETVSLVATPRPAEIDDGIGGAQQGWRLGVVRRGVIEHRRLDPFSAAWRSVEQTGEFIGMTMGALGQIIIGTRSTSELGGPLRIAQMSGQMAEFGIVPLIMFMAVLSINLGLINLFPIPVLDGGHLVFYAIEAVRGRPVGERVQDVSFRIGLAMVLTLMVFATWNDLIQVKFFDFLSGMFS